MSSFRTLSASLRQSLRARHQPNSFSRSFHAPVSHQSAFKTAMNKLPVEVYPLVGLCSLGPIYGVYAGFMAVKDGGEFGYLRLLPQRFSPVVEAHTEKNVWDN